MNIWKQVAKKYRKLYIESQGDCKNLSTRIDAHEEWIIALSEEIVRLEKKRTALEHRSNSFKEIIKLFAR